MKAVIYARVSSDNGRQDTARQIAQLTDYATKNGIVLIGSPFEDFQSGATPNAERWVLNNCIKFCIGHREEVDCILMTEVSRLGRDPWEMIELIKTFHDNHINVFFLAQNLFMFDEDGKDNPYFGTVFSFFSKFAEQERSAIQDRLKSGYENFRKKGGKVGRKVGFRKSREQKEEEYRPVLKKLQDGMSIRDVAKVCDVSESTVQRLKKEFRIQSRKKH